MKKRMMNLPMWVMAIALVLGGGFAANAQGEEAPAETAPMVEPIPQPPRPPAPPAPTPTPIPTPPMPQPDPPPVF
jgi:hypothetical protein